MGEEEAPRGRGRDGEEGGLGPGGAAGWHDLRRRPTVVVEAS